MITKKEAQHIAKLARLDLSQKEIEKMQKELSLILDYFNLLKEINTERVAPTSHSIEIESVMRKDESKKEDIEKINKLIEMTPEKKKRYIRVRSIFQ